ncbi:hypothetical protein C8Q73DRAFT_792474 [Cubamyces lactineus]|nr:hypothetical protein C8Q73DRAFT_792474 [Cubamyces lactineus]
MATTTASDLSNIKEGIGAWLVGVFMTTFLVGMTVQQAFHYFRLYPRDATFLKAWVVLTVSLQMLTIAFAMHTAYYYLVTYYLDPIVFLKRDVWTAAVVPIFGPLNNFASESFFARRVYLIGHRYRIIVLSATLMILASCGFFVSRTIQAFTATSVFASTQTDGWLPAVASALLLAGDIQLTAVLVYALHTGRSGIRRTDSMIDLLIAYAISSGTLICVLNIVSLILSIIYPHNIIYTASTLVAQGVYTNSFIVALNTRRVVCSRGELDNTNLETKVVLGGRDPSGTVVDQIALDVQSAAGSSGVEDDAAAKVDEASAPSGSFGVRRDEKLELMV